MKYAKRKTSKTVCEVGLGAPWPEHKIEFNMDAIRAKGYIGVERDSLGAVNGYKFIRSDGPSQFIRVELVLIQKMARKV